MLEQDRVGTKQISILAIILISIVVIGVTVFMTLKNTYDLQHILEESIKSELISASVAARGILDIERFDSYNSLDDIYRDYEAYQETLESLRKLRRQIGVKYIYALKLLDGKYYFIFDTDEEYDTLLDEYELSYVHERAFMGFDNAGIMNVTDEYGSFNTGAVPIWLDDRIIGIISADIVDEYVQESTAASSRNSIILVSSLVFTMLVLVAIVLLLLRNVWRIQDTLYQMANFDVLTGLPNRQYLMSYLDTHARRALKFDEPFAFLLVDLDNFKMVNDGEGHTAGDELLRDFAKYMDSIHDDSKSFRPPAGALGASADALSVSARIGGDEFVQIVHGVRNEDEARAIAEKMLDNFTSETIDCYVEQYEVGLSIGVALFPLHTEDFNDLIKYADDAMYAAKNNGKRSYRIYSEDMEKRDSVSLPALPEDDRRKRQR